MPRIERLKQPIGPEHMPYAVEVLPGEFAREEDAVREIEQFISHYHYCGFNEEQAYLVAPQH